MGVRASLASSPARTFPTHSASIQAPSFLVVSLASWPHSHISLPIFCMHELQPLFLGKAAEPPWHSLAYRHRCFVTAPVASLHHRCLLSSLRTLDSLPTHLPVVELQPPTPFPLIFHSRSAAVTAAPLMAGTTTSPSVPSLYKSLALTLWRRFPATSPLPPCPCLLPAQCHHRRPVRRWRGPPQSRCRALFDLRRRYPTPERRSLSSQARRHSSLPRSPAIFPLHVRRVEQGRRRQTYV